jgi:hypothetical protein
MGLRWKHWKVGLSDAGHYQKGHYGQAKSDRLPTQSIRSKWFNGTVERSPLVERVPDENLLIMKELFKA